MNDPSTSAYQAQNNNAAYPTGGLNGSSQQSHPHNQQTQQQPQQQYGQHPGIFESDYDLMKRSFDNVNLSGTSNSAGNSPQVDGQAFGADKKTRYNTVSGGLPMMNGQGSGQGQPQQMNVGLNLSGFNPGTGILGATDNLGRSANGLPGSMVGGIPGFPDYGMYASAAGSGNPASSSAAAFAAGPMAQQPSQTSSYSASSGTSQQPFSDQQQQQHPGLPSHQRNASLTNGMAPFQGSFSENPAQYGLVGAAPTVGLFQNAMPPNAYSSPFMSSVTPADGFSSLSPSGQAMSAMSSQSGTGLSSSVNSTAQGTTPISPMTAYTPNFGGSPMLNQALLNASQGLGMGGMYGLGAFGVPNLSFGGLGMPMPLGGSPHLSAAALSPQLTGLSWLDGSSPLTQWPAQLGGNDAAAVNAMASALAASASGNLNNGAMSREGMEVVRTVYVGNLPGDASVDELLSLVRYGPIESVKILPDKSCAFISFLDPGIAAAFHSDACLRKISLHGLDLKIGWGKATAIPPPVLQAVHHFGATRNVYLGNLDDTFMEETLRDDLSRYGHIDQVKIVRDKNIGFVHFLSISTAMKVVTELPKEPEWTGKRVNYGKDRCAYVPRNQHQQQQHNQMAAAMAQHSASQLAPFHPLSPMPLSPTLSPMPFSGGFVDPNVQAGNRCIYLGNLHPDTTCEDICNTVRGGIIESIKLIEEKHICFIHFVMPESAVTLHQIVSQNGLMVRNRRLKVGWGKNTGPCPPGIVAIVGSGGSRNVYIGNIDDFETFTVDRIKQDLSEFGEIEQVNALAEKSCAFTNFTNIKSAIKAIEGLRRHPEYSKFKIAYGKDRVGNMARQPAARRPYNNNRGHHQGGYQQQQQFSQSYNGHPDSQNASSSGHDYLSANADGAMSRSTSGGLASPAARTEERPALTPQSSAAHIAATAVQSAEREQGLA